jgi:hypothetical protein
MIRSPGLAGEPPAWFGPSFSAAVWSTAVQRVSAAGLHSVPAVGLAGLAARRGMRNGIGMADGI